MDFVAFAEDERSHFRVPEAGLMSKMDARFQHLSHGHAGHKTLLVGLSLRVSQSATRFSLEIEGLSLHLANCSGHPADCDDTRAGLLKIAALYTMNAHRKQSPRESLGLASICYE